MKTIKDYIVQNVRDTGPIELPFGTKQKIAAKDHVLTDYGQFETSVYFIQSGVVITTLLYREEQRILDFHFPESFCASYSSLLTATASDIRLTCYKDCVLEVVDYEELQRCYQTSLLANQLGRIATEQLYVTRVQREKELLTMTAEQRYESLLKKNPGLVRTIPIKDLSKYLGVRPESLSRIRRQ
ncbi:MAG: Crp/Fnr family transcriptional regulator [Bacteroidota bacterium]